MFLNRSPLMVALGGMVLMAVVMGIGRFIYTPILPFMISADVLDRSGAGLVAGSNYLGYLLGALLTGSSRLTFDRRKVMYAGAVFSFITTALMAVTSDFTAFLIIRFVSGLASAFAMIFVSSIVFELAAKTGKPHLSAIQFSGVGVGITISAFTLSVVSPDQLHWQTLWWIAAILSLLGILLAFAGIGPKKTTSELENFSSEPTGTTVQVPQISNPGVALGWLIVSYGLFGFGYIITATFISELAASTPQLAETRNFVWLVVGMAAASLTYPLTRIADRVGNLRCYALFCLVEALGVGLSVLVLHPVAIIIAAILLGSTFITITVVGLRSANQLIQAIQRDPSASIFGKWDERIAVALMTASFGAGQVLGPVLAGFLFEKFENLLFVSLCAAAALVISAFIATLLELVSSRQKLQ